MAAAPSVCGSARQPAMSPGSSAASRTGCTLPTRDPNARPARSRPDAPGAMSKIAPGRRSHPGPATREPPALANAQDSGATRKASVVTVDAPSGGDMAPEGRLNPAPVGSTSRWRAGAIASPPDAPRIAQLLQQTRERLVRKDPWTHPMFAHEQQHAADQDREANTAECGRARGAEHRGQCGRDYEVAAPYCREPPGVAAQRSPGAWRCCAVQCARSTASHRVARSCRRRRPAIAAPTVAGSAIPPSPAHRRKCPAVASAPRGLACAHVGGQGTQ